MTLFFPMPSAQTNLTVFLNPITAGQITDQNNIDIDR